MDSSDLKITFGEDYDVSEQLSLMLERDSRRYPRDFSYSKEDV